MFSTFRFSRLFWMLSVITVVFSFSSCKEDEDDDDHSGQTTFKLSFLNYLDDGALDYGHEHMLANNRKFSVELSRYYVSNIRLEKEDGTEVPFPGKYLLVKHDLETLFEIGQVDGGHYHKLKFDIGVDSATNHSDPSTRAASDPLAIQDPGVHWSWNSGYIFMRVEGMVDTSSTPDGTTDFLWWAHLGTDALLTPVEMDLHTDAVEGTDFVLNVKFDHQALFDGVDLGGADLGTHTMGNMPMAIQSNIPGAFSIME